MKTRPPVTTGMISTHFIKTTKFIPEKNVDLKTTGRKTLDDTTNLSPSFVSHLTGAVTMAA